MYNVYSAASESLKISYRRSFDLLEDAIAYKLAIREHNDVAYSWIEINGSAQYSR